MGEPRSDRFDRPGLGIALMLLTMTTSTCLDTNAAAGYLTFRQLPDAWSFVGAGVVIAGGLYVFRRERLGAV